MERGPVASIRSTERVNIIHREPPVEIKGEGVGYIGDGMNLHRIFDSRINLIYG